MKRLVHALLLATASAASQHATAAAYCQWDPGHGLAPTVLIRTLPTAYVPANAPVGTVIGDLDSRLYTGPQGGPNFVRCRNDGSVMMRFYTTSLVPIWQGTLPPFGVDDPNGHVLQTNVPGVGVMIRADAPFNGVAQNQFLPDSGTTRPLVPFNSHKDTDTQIGIVIGGLIAAVTLIKTGDIAPGVHQLDGPLYQGFLDYDNIGVVFRYTLRGTIIQAQCSIVGDPVSANPVQLGEWEAADFTGEGFSTPPIPFHITLSSCQTDPGGMTQATIELQGVNGSQPVGSSAAGVFSLTSDSTAKGMGIQVLRDDGSPLALDSEVPLVPLTNGQLQLNFAARFFQTAPSHSVQPGAAKGALSFTIRYR